MEEEAAKHVESGAKEKPEGKPRIPMVVVVAVLVVLGVALAFFFLVPSQQDASPTIPLKDAPAYAAQIELSELQLSAAENFLGQQVVFLDGKIANQGSETVRLVQARLFFRDFMDQVILREEKELVSVRSQPLRPGEVQEFQLAFDRLPGSWNVQVPEIEFPLIRIE